MTTEQIIKALECCANNPFERGLSKCNECPYIENGNCHLGITLLNDALALIKELQAHNENLKKENKYLRESLADEREHKEDMEGKDE